MKSEPAFNRLNVYFGHYFPGHYYAGAMYGLPRDLIAKIIHTVQKQYMGGSYKDGVTGLWPMGGMYYAGANVTDAPLKPELAIRKQGISCRGSLL